MFNNQKKEITGNCECCDKKDVVVTPKHGNMLMCETCIALETSAVKVVEESRKQDDTIQVKTDVHVAVTTSFAELQAAIQNNPAIPADQKEYALAKEIALHIQKLSAVIHAKETSVAKDKNDRQDWVTSIQNIVPKLQENYRKTLPQYDINYVAGKPTKKEKTVKAVRPARARAQFDKVKLFEAAKKYDVPVSQVQSIIVSKNCSEEAAAKHLAGLLGKL